MNTRTRTKNPNYIRPNEETGRNSVILAALKSGISQAEVARAFGITKSRVNQLWKDNTSQSYKDQALVTARRKAMQAIKRVEYFLPHKDREELRLAQQAAFEAVLATEQPQAPLPPEIENTRENRAFIEEKVTRKRRRYGSRAS